MVKKISVCSSRQDSLELNSCENKLDPNNNHYEKMQDVGYHIFLPIPNYSRNTSPGIVTNSQVAIENTVLVVVEVNLVTETPWPNPVHRVARDYPIL